MTSKLKALVDHAAEFAVKMFEKEHHVAAMWIADTAAGKRMVFAAQMTHKDALVASMRRLFKEHRVVRYAFMTEAWKVMVPDGRLPAAPPSEHPDRREILMIQAGDTLGRALMVTYYILRPEHGPPQLKLSNIEGDEIKGRFANLLTADRE